MDLEDENENIVAKLTAMTLAAGLVGQAAAEEWNVSVWGKRRAFTEHIEKLESC